MSDSGLQYFVFVFPYNAFVQFRCRMMIASQNELGSIFSASFLGKTLQKSVIISSSNVWQTSTVNPSGSGAFCLWWLLIVNSTSLDISLFKLSISSCMNFGSLCLLRNQSISPRLSNVVAQSCLQYFFIILLMSLRSE